MMNKNTLKIAFYLFISLFFAACTSLGLGHRVNRLATGTDLARSCEQNCRITLPDGAIYHGEMLDGIPNGQGKLLWANGSRYEGSFQNGELHGDGVLLADNGDKYVGEFVSDMLEGEGFFSFVNGSKYIGGFKGNAFDGYGVLTKANGDEYVGGFRNNLFHGKGILYFGDAQIRPRLLAGEWENGRYDTFQEGVNGAEKEDDLIAEVVLFYQYQMLSEWVDRIEPSRPGITDLYFISFGGDAFQDVFMKEALYTKKLFETQYGLQNRTMQLINNTELIHDSPIASVINLKVALQIIAEQMDVEEDILFLYLTSHGSKDHTLSLRLGGVPLADLSAESLGEILKESGIKWKVIAISACYSGGFIDHLKDDRSMIITSARADRSSFGCSDDSEMTYFGRAFFKHALDRSTTFIDAFAKAKEIVAHWEDRDDFVHSEPQIYSTPLIEAKLKEWRLTLDQKVAAGIRHEVSLPSRSFK